MATPSHKAVIADLSKLADALDKHARRKRFILLEKSYTGAQLAAFVRGIIATRTRLILAKVELIAAARAQRSAQKESAKLLDALRFSLIVAHAHDTAMLSEFALTLQRPRRRATTEELALRGARARATRAKRRTMGKKQKAAIKGDVSRVVITPVVGNTKPADDA
jgi:hypothetical protein